MAKGPNTIHSFSWYFDLGQKCFSNSFTENTFIDYLIGYARDLMECISICDKYFEVLKSMGF